MSNNIEAEKILDKYYEPKMHWKLVNRANVLKAMEEYANQYQQQHKAAGVWVETDEETQNRLAFWNDAAGKWECSQSYIKQTEQPTSVQVGYSEILDFLTNEEYKPREVKWWLRTVLIPFIEHLKPPVQVTDEEIEAMAEKEYPPIWGDESHLDGNERNRDIFILGYEQCININEENIYPLAKANGCGGLEHIFLKGFKAAIRSLVLNNSADKK